MVKDCLSKLLTLNLRIRKMERYLSDGAIKDMNEKKESPDERKEDRRKGYCIMETKYDKRSGKDRRKK